ncbi:hypothetical protein LCGC14_1207840 [marine sediment metagenome]|uniref:Uncharacterized protein n=1 Tax=marine sediment metagenome TaxID=412755 RepID=A0A0F9NX97_9ZZZZ|nr:hypothetical protein [Actinomycetota bacterium]
MKIGDTVSVMSRNRHRRNYGSGVVTGFYKYGLFVDTGDVKPTCFSWQANDIRLTKPEKE